MPTTTETMTQTSIALDELLSLVRGGPFSAAQALALPARDRDALNRLNYMVQRLQDEGKEQLSQKVRVLKAIFRSLGEEDLEELKNQGLGQTLGGLSLVDDWIREQRRGRQHRCAECNEVLNISVRCRYCDEEFRRSAEVRQADLNRAREQVEQLQEVMRGVRTDPEDPPLTPLFIDDEDSDGDPGAVDWRETLSMDPVPEAVYTEPDDCQCCDCVDGVSG